MNRFLQQQHRAFRAPASLVFDLTARATGHEPLRREKIVRGYENEVYRVATSGGAAIVKIRRWGDVPLEQEAWAMDQGRRAGLPVPQVLLVEPVEIEGQALQAMVQSGAPGQPLKDLRRDLAPADLAAILRQLGALLGRLHRIPIAGFGRRQPDGGWQYPSWTAVLEPVIQRREQLRPLIEQAGFTAAEFAFMLEALRQYPQQFPRRRPVLCHGDVELGHVYVDDQLQIVGLIDFGQVQGGSPLVDFIYLSFEVPELDLTPLLEAYPDRALVQDRFALQLHLQRLDFLLGCVAHTVAAGDVEVDKTVDAAGHLRRTLAFLREQC